MGAASRRDKKMNRGKMPLPRLPIETWERHLAATLTNPSLLDKSHRSSHGNYGSRLSKCHCI